MLSTTTSSPGRAVRRTLSPVPRRAPTRTEARTCPPRPCAAGDVAWACPGTVKMISLAMNCSLVEPRSAATGARRPGCGDLAHGCQTAKGFCFRKVATGPIVNRFGVWMAGMPLLMCAWKVA